MRPGSPTLKQGRANRGRVKKTGCAPSAWDFFLLLLSISSQRMRAVRNPLERRALPHTMHVRKFCQTAFDHSPARPSRVSSSVCSQPRPGSCHRACGRRRVSKSRTAATPYHPTQSARQELPSHAHAYCGFVLAFAESRRQEKRKRAKKRKEKQDRQIDAEPHVFTPHPPARHQTSHHPGPAYTLESHPCFYG